MMTSAGIALRYASGTFTPFLLPLWGATERRAVEAWRAGQAAADTVGRLEARFQAQFAPGWSVKATGSGRGAITYALSMIGASPGSEVIVPSFSCAAIPEAVRRAGLQPVLADMDQDLNLSIDGVRSVDGPAVKAVIVPHFGGLWNRSLPAIVDWAATRGIAVIEDAAQSLGVTRDGQPAGILGQYGIYSFGVGKPIFGPGGGMLVWRAPNPGPDIGKADRGREERRLGAYQERYLSARIRRGLTTLRQRVAPDDTPPDTIEWQGIGLLDAMVAQGQLDRIDSIVQQQRDNAERWRGLLARAGLADRIRMPPHNDNVFDKAWFAVPAASAARVRRRLRYHGIEVETLYTPLHRRAAYAQCRRGDLPVTDDLAPRVFAVPVRPNLTAHDWRRIERAINALPAEMGQA